MVCWGSLRGWQLFPTLSALWTPAKPYVSCNNDSYVTNHILTTTFMLGHVSFLIVFLRLIHYQPSLNFVHIASSKGGARYNKSEILTPNSITRETKSLKTARHRRAAVAPTVCMLTYWSAFYSKSYFPQFGD